MSARPKRSLLAAAISNPLLVNKLIAKRQRHAGAKGHSTMSGNELPEKRTVARSDELLRKSRRLIDELEFILDKLPKELSQNPEADRDGGEKHDDSRSAEDTQ